MTGLHSNTMRRTGSIFSLTLSDDGTLRDSKYRDGKR